MTTLSRGRVVALGASHSEAPVHSPVSKPSLGYIASQTSVDAAQRATRILADAESAAAARLDQANRQIAQMRDEIREQVTSELAIEHARKLTELTLLRARVIQHAREEIVQLAQLLAHRIIGEELLLDPGKQVELAARVLRDTGGAARIVIHAAPDAAEVLREGLCCLETTTPARIEIVTDTHLSYGDLRIETDVGSIDARVATQLSHLVSAIVESLHS